MKLNLGCYDKQLPGFVNVDIREDVNPDIVDDAFKLQKFENNSVDEIYCCHMFEHLTLDQANLALKRWYEVLKEGGILRLSVPDMDATMRRYLYTGDLKEVRALIFGSQKHQFDYHYTGWDFKTLSEALYSHYYSSVHIWNWWNVLPYRYIDDFSKAYLPSDSPDIALSHGRVIKGGGMLMSLNIAAIKHGTFHED